MLVSYPPFVPKVTLYQQLSEDLLEISISGIKCQVQHKWDAAVILTTEQTVTDSLHNNKALIELCVKIINCPHT